MEFTNWAIETVSIFRLRAMVSGNTNFSFSAAGFCSCEPQDVKKSAPAARSVRRVYWVLNFFCILIRLIVGILLGLVVEVRSCVIINVFEGADPVEADGIQLERVLFVRIIEIQEFQDA